MLLTLRLEELRQKRLARIAILKEVMSKKLNAQKLRDILKMMRRMTMEDLEMEIEEVEAKAMELMDMEVEEGSDTSYMETGRLDIDEVHNQNISMSPACLPCDAGVPSVA